MFKNRKLFGKKTIALAGAVLASGALALGSPAMAASNIKAQLCPDFNIVVDGSSRTFYTASGTQAHPIVYNGTTYLPLRAVGELMGKNVDWNQQTLTVTISGTRTTAAANGTPDKSARRQNIQAQLRDDFTIISNGSKCSFADANGNAAYPLLYNGSTYLPLRAVGELMGKSVAWDASSSTVTLSGGSIVTDADSFGGVSAGQNQNAAQGSVISLEDAKAKALAHAGISDAQAAFTKQETDWDDGRKIYEIEFYYNNTEYEYEIDAYSGEILKFDRDYDDDGYYPYHHGEYHHNQWNEHRNYYGCGGYNCWR